MKLVLISTTVVPSALCLPPTQEFKSQATLGALRAEFSMDFVCTAFVADPSASTLFRAM